MSLLLLRGGVVAGGGQGSPYTFAYDFDVGELAPTASGGPDPYQYTPQPSWSSSGGSLQTAVKRPGKTHALRFHFDRPGEGDYGPERRFVWGQPIGGEGRTVWFEWWNYVGVDFYALGSAGESKWFQFWNKAYTWSATIGCSLRPDGAGGYNCLQAISGSGVDQAGFTGEYYTGVFFTPNPTYPSGPTKLIRPAGASPSGALIPGQWHKVRMEVTWASSFLAVDGRYRIWIDDALFQDSGAVNIHNNRDERLSGDPIALTGGYLMGYSNTGYQNDVSWYWSDLTITNVNPGWGY